MQHADILRALEGLGSISELSCVRAHDLSAKLGVSPLEVGEAIDRTSIRVYRCQLGLFGYGSKAAGKSKIVLPATNVPAEIEAALRSLATEGRIPCRQVWELAERFEYPRLGVANVIEALGLRVWPCQLGCFKPHSSDH